MLRQFAIFLKDDTDWGSDFNKKNYVNTFSRDNNYYHLWAVTNILMILNIVPWCNTPMVHLVSKWMIRKSCLYDKIVLTAAWRSFSNLLSRL